MKRGGADRRNEDYIHRWMGMNRKNSVHAHCQAELEEGDMSIMGDN